MSLEEPFGSLSFISFSRKAKRLLSQSPHTPFATKIYVFGLNRSMVPHSSCPNYIRPLEGPPKGTRTPQNVFCAVGRLPWEGS